MPTPRNHFRTAPGHRESDTPARDQDIGRVIQSLRGSSNDWHEIPIVPKRDGCILCGEKLFHFCYCRGCYMDWRYGEKKPRPTHRKGYWRKYPPEFDGDRTKGIWRNKHGYWERYVPQTTTMITRRHKEGFTGRQDIKPAKPPLPSKYEGAKCVDCGSSNVYSNDRCFSHAHKYHHHRPREEYGGKSYYQVKYEREQEAVKARVKKWAKENRAKRRAIEKRYRAKPEVRERANRLQRESRARQRAAA